MSAAAVRRVASRLRPGGALTDAELVLAITPSGVERETAFADLVSRYGPMVLGVCRRVLADAHAAEDAFQAVFLVLARKADTICPPGSVGGWLYGVAVRTARKAKAAAARRRRREMAAVYLATSTGHAIGTVTDPVGALDRSELRTIIDAELTELPDTHRAAIILCDLQGKTRAEAAAELQRAEGTVAAWLARGRKTLADRLARRGVALSSAGLAAVLTPSVVSAELSSAVAGAFTGRGAPESVLTLAEGVMRSLSSASTKPIALACAAGALLAAVTTATAWHVNPEPPPIASAVAPVRKLDEPKIRPEPRAVPPVPVERNQDLWVWRDRPRPFPLNAGGLTWADGVAFRPDGKAFTVVGGDGSGSEVLTLGTAKLKDVPIEGPAGATTPMGVEYAFDGKAPAVPIGVAYSPDGKLIAVPQPGRIEIRDSATRRTLKTLEQKGSKPTAVAFGPITAVQGRIRYQVAYTDGRAIWAATWIDTGVPGTAQFGPLLGAPKLDGPPHAGVAYAPDGKRLVFIPNDKVDPAWPGAKAETPRPDPRKATHWYAMVWGGGSGEPIAFLKHVTDPVTAVAWATDGRIATADAAGVVVIWDGETCKERKRVKLSGPVTALAFRADGKRFAAGVRAPAKVGEEGAVRVEVVTEQEGSEPDNWQTSSRLGLSVAETVRSVAFAPDGLVLVAGAGTADGKGGGLRVWDRVQVAPK